MTTTKEGCVLTILYLGLMGIFVLLVVAIMGPKPATKPIGVILAWVIVIGSCPLAWFIVYYWQKRSSTFPTHSNQNYSLQKPAYKQSVSQQHSVNCPKCGIKVEGKYCTKCGTEF